METFLTDSGPLVALLNLRDEHHEWAREQFKHFSDPLLTCEGAITEATHMLQFDGLPPWGVLELIERKIVAVQFDLESNLDRVLFADEKVRGHTDGLRGRLPGGDDGRKKRLPFNHP